MTDRTMDNSEKYLDPKALARLQGLQLRAKHLVEGYVAGLHRSPQHGFSIEFSEHREYVPGDDLRYLDWKLYGRTDKYFLKQFEDETNLVCYIVLDVSESMFYRSEHSALSKLDYAKCVAATLAWLILQRRDAVGLICYDDQVRQFSGPSNRSAYIRDVISVLNMNTEPSRTETGAVLREVAERVRSRSVILLLSDLLDDAEQIVAGLKHLRYREHDVAVFQLLDPAEVDFPFRRPMRFRGLEQLTEATANPQALRQAYLTELRRFQEIIRRACQIQQIDFQVIRTDQRLDVPISQFLTQRALHA